MFLGTVESVCLIIRIVILLLWSYMFHLVEVTLYENDKRFDETTESVRLKRGVHLKKGVRLMRCPSHAPVKFVLPPSPRGSPGIRRKMRVMKKGGALKKG